MGLAIRTSSPIPPHTQTQTRYRLKLTTGWDVRFVVVSVLNKRQQTPVQKKTLNPVYAAKDSTFDFPIYLSLADRLGVVELVVWDKDMIRKDYLGEAGVPLDEWFRGGRGYGFEDPGNEVCGFFLAFSFCSRISLDRLCWWFLSISFIDEEEWGTYSLLAGETDCAGSFGTHGLLACDPWHGLVMMDDWDWRWALMTAWWDPSDPESDDGRPSPILSFPLIDRAQLEYRFCPSRSAVVQT